ncbi:MAG: L,D-transpeptidase [Longimicrobiaceae bacterium]
MEADTKPDQRRGTGAERRDTTPPGRLRRIFFDHAAATGTLAGCALLVLLLFAATSAFAVNERFKRDVTVIAHSHDLRSLRFLRQQELSGTAELARTVARRGRDVSSAIPAGGEPYLVVSIEEKRVWYLDGTDTLFSAPVAVGSGAMLVLESRTLRFQTPRGRMHIQHKELDPVWIPPAWHYHEIARKHGLEVVDMSRASPDALAGFPPGEEPIRGGKIYIPPLGSPQRRHQGVLGVAKLEMQDGYYFHGTQQEETIGTAASHGCIRMLKDDVLWMYEHVPLETEVFIY